MPQTNYISKEMFACLKRYWGYTQFRPWQEDTMNIARCLEFSPFIGYT